MSQRFACAVAGIDVDGSRFEPCDNSNVHLQVMDAARMSFPDASFDFLFSFHAIEHIAELDAAFAEMRRVLKPSGAFCIGTPNKKRLIGYMGVASTFRHKLLWNLEDWGMRLKGRWENHLGAHAGFVDSELLAMCQQAFGDGANVTDAYYRRLYRSRSSLIEAIIKAHLGMWIFPAVYAVGRRIS